MIRKHSLLFGAIVAAMSLTMCTKETPAEEPVVEPEDETVTLVSPVLTLSSSDVVISDDNINSEALKLTWTSAVPEGKTAKLSYIVYVNLASKDLYTNPQTVNAASALEYAFSGSELNSVLVALGVEEGAEAEIQMSVYAKPESFDIESTVSDAVKAKVKGYEEIIEVPDVLYLVGSATEAGWDVSKGIPVSRNDKGIFHVEGVNINLTISDTGFKFYFTNDGSSTCFFGPDRSSDTFGTAILYKEDDGTANLFQPALNGYESGVYTIEFDDEAMMMTMTKTGEIAYVVDYGEYVYPQGGCFEWGWTFTDNMAKTADKVYEMTSVKCNWGDNKDNGFKIFIADGVWSPYFAQAEGATYDNIGIQLVTDSDVPQFYPGQLGYVNGTYDIKADFNTMVLTLTLIEADPEPTPAADKFYLVGVLNNGTTDWSCEEKNSLTAKGDGIYESESPITIGEWAYFKLATSDWSQEYVRDQTADNYWTFTARTKDPDNDCNFCPSDYDHDTYKGGSFNVKMDLNAKTLTLTAAESPAPAVQKLYLVGVLNNGTTEWSMDEANAVVCKNGDGIYESESPITIGEWAYFKLATSDWSTEYVRDQTAENYWTFTARTKDPDNDCNFCPSDYDHDTFCGGQFNVKVDVNTKTITVTKAGSTVVVDEDAAFFLYGGGFENGVSDWAFDVKNALVEGESGIYTSAAPIYLNKWCYFKFEKKDWTEYVRDQTVDSYWTVTARTHDPDNDSTFSPGSGDDSFVDGNYTVVLNLNTKKVTITKAE